MIHKALKYSLILLLSITINSLSAQDAHFTQYNAAPLLVNPAHAGTMAGTFRISTVYRDQWRAALDHPFKTYALSADTKFGLGETNGDFVGAGIVVFADRSGLFDQSTTEISLTGAYHKLLSKKSQSYVSGAFQAGIAQRSIGYAELTFGDQFNAIDGYTLTSQEELPPNNFGIADFSLGLLYSAQPSATMSYQLGAGYYHFNRPNISFYSKDDNVNPLLIKENKMFSKLSIHGQMTFEVNEAIQWSPRFLYLQQGPHNEANIGANMRFQPKPNAARAIHMGAALRAGNHVDGFSMNAASLMAGFEINNWILGVSYDQNLEDIAKNRFGLSSIEVSIIYIGEHDNNIGWCPEF